MNWTHDDAIKLCVTLEAQAIYYGMHVALTGGLLYGDLTVEHKDCDVILYRIRQQEMDVQGFLKSLAPALTRVDDNDNPWCHKFVTPHGRKIDFLVPEAPRTKKLEDESTYSE